jgi:hypothetical protein
VFRKKILLSQNELPKKPLKIGCSKTQDKQDMFHMIKIKNAKYEKTCKLDARKCGKNF